MLRNIDRNEDTTTAKTITVTAHLTKLIIIFFERIRSILSIEIMHVVLTEINWVGKPGGVQNHPINQNTIYKQFAPEKILN